jgi:hypothetical protein
MTEQALSLEPDNAVDAAIARVLQAERAAAQDIAAAAAEASLIAEAARAQVRELERRTERRIRALREAFAARTERELEALARAAANAAAPIQISTEDGRRVHAAVERLAAELTGAAP